MNDADKTETQELPCSDSWLMQYYTEEKFSADDDADEVAEPAFILTSCPPHKYERDHVVGEGGMKTVYQTIDFDSNRKVAMAVLNRESKPSMVRRFVREARLTAMLEHPNIVPIHDVGVNEEGEPYFVMKYIEGENLSTVLKKLRDGAEKYRKRYTLNYLLDIFQRVCNAIAFAHSKGVLHLDLKPSNIQVSDFGEVLVVDWGIAKIIAPPEGQLTEELKEMSQQDIDRTRDGTMKGSPGYMAPEQAIFNQSLKDYRTDIYALGAILYSILTWKLHSKGTNVDEVVTDTIEGNIIPPKTRTPERTIPAALEAMTMKALSRKPENRYQQVEKILSDLEAFRGGYVTSAENLGPLGLLRSLILRNKLASAAVAAVLITGTFFGAVSINKIRKSEAEAHESLGQLKISQIQAEFALAESRENLRLASDRLESLDLVREQNIRIGKYASPRLVQEAKDLLQRLDFDLAATKLFEALAWQEDNLEGKIAKAYVHLGRREFKQAQIHFEQARKSPDEVFPGEELIERYWNGVGQEVVNLDKDEMMEFVNDVQNTKRLPKEFKRPIAALLLSDWNKTYGLEAGHMDEVWKAVQIFNPKAKDAKMEFSLEGNTLRLKLTDSINIQHLLPLFGLPLIRLDLEQTRVRDLDFMKGMDSLQHLNLSHTPISNIDVLYELPLRQLNLTDCKRLGKIEVDRFLHLETLIVSKRLEKYVKAHISAGNSSPRVVLR